LLFACLGASSLVGSWSVYSWLSEVGRGACSMSWSGKMGEDVKLRDCLTEGESGVSDFRWPNVLIRFAFGPVVIWTSLLSIRPHMFFPNLSFPIPQ
jgi:hypothetical protein